MKDKYRTIEYAPPPDTILVSPWFGDDGEVSTGMCRMERLQVVRVTVPADAPDPVELNPMDVEAIGEGTGCTSPYRAIYNTRTGDWVFCSYGSGRGIRALVAAFAYAVAADDAAGMDSCDGCPANCAVH